MGKVLAEIKQPLYKTKVFIHKTVDGFLFIVKINFKFFTAVKGMLV